MKLADSIRLSANSIIHRKLRSWLTLLGIIIGVAAVVSIVSIGEGAQASVSAQLSGFGADIITISPGFERAGGFMGFMRGGHEEGPSRSGTQTATASKDSTLTKNDSAIIRGNPDVLYVTETVSGRGEMVFLAEKSNVSIQGVNPNTWAQTSNLALASGRPLTASDSTGIVIGDRVANSNFKQKINLGRTVTIDAKPFTVVGILATSGESFGGGNDSAVFMSLSSAWTVTDVNKGTYSSIKAKVRSADIVDQTTQELTESLLISRKVNEKNQDFTITSAQAIKEQISSVTQTLTLFLGAIAAISLIVGAVGVANSMFTSVLEKTKEIGILKALGATNNEVLLLFVIESGLFGLTGGVIGVILGTLASGLISSTGILPINIPTMRGRSSTLVTPELVIIAILLSTIIGIVAGILPARAAARLKPVEALRYE